MMGILSGVMDVAFLRRFRALFCHTRAICAARFQAVSRFSSPYVE